MRTALAAIAILFATALVGRALAADAYPITDADKRFLSEVVGALQKNDSAWIAAHMVYPLSVVVSHRTRMVRSKEEFAPIVARQLTHSLRTNIIALAKEPLFKNWQGAMVGDGLLWFTQYQSAGHKGWAYGIFAIGHFASQPKDAMQPKQTANYPAAGNARSALQFAIARQWPGVPEPGR